MQQRKFCLKIQLDNMEAKFLQQMFLLYILCVISFIEGDSVKIKLVGGWKLERCATMCL